MKKYAILPVALLTARIVAAQVVHPTNASVVTLNWRQTTTADSLALDLDGDNAADITFRCQANMVYLPGDTPAMQLVSYARLRQNGFQLANDSTVQYYVHRFQAGDAIRHGLFWSTRSAGLRQLELSYYYGSPNAYGNFQHGNPGYVVVRKQQPSGAWQYWWIQLSTRYQNTKLLQVFLYGTATTITGIQPVREGNTRAYPNPTVVAWQLPAGAGGEYKVLDSMARIVGIGRRQPAQLTQISAIGLPVGVYWLIYEENGRVQRQQLLKQ